MLKISKQQMEVFSDHERRRFENLLSVELAVLLPKRCYALGESGVRAMIRDGTRRAACYGLDSERGVSVFVTAMVALGPDFDANPELPWARRILTDRMIDGPLMRTLELCDALLDHLEPPEAECDTGEEPLELAEEEEEGEGEEDDDLV